MPTQARYYSSNAAKTTLAASISSSATSLTLAAASNLPAQYPYTLILEKDTANEEVVEVTGLVGSAYQITRNIDSSGAKAHAFGANVEHGVSARDFTESRQHEVATTSVHGVTGDVVGTSGSQTLTSKTLTTATLGSALDAGGYKITNLATPTSSSDAVRKDFADAQVAAASTSASSASTSASSAATSASSSATSAASSALSYTTFNDQYLGSKSSAPTLNNSGGPLVNGNLYFNTTDSTLYVRNAGAWQAAAVSTSGFATLGTNAFTAAQTITIASGTAIPLKITNAGTNYSFLVEDEASTDTTPFLIDANGTIVTGYTSALSADGYSGLTTSPRFQVQGTTGAGSAIGLSNWANNAASAAALAFNKSKSGTIGTYSATVSGDDIGGIVFNGDDGTALIRSSLIFAEVDGTVSTGVVPGRIGIHTADATTGTITERMRIDSKGSIGIGGTASAGTTLRIGKNLTGAVTSYGIYNNNAVQSDVTTSAQLFSTFPSVVDTAFTLGSLVHFQASQGTKGASATITSQYGYLASSTLTGATNNYGFYSGVAAATGAWGFYGFGTANNYMAGRLGVGLAITTGAMMQITNTTASDIAFVIKGAAAQSNYLTQWKDSADTQLARVESNGTFVSPSHTSLDASGYSVDIALMNIMGAY